MKKVLLIGPYNPECRVGQYLAPPLGVYRIASYLKRKNVADVDVVDPSLDVHEIFRKLSSTEYDIIGHSVLHPTIENDIQLMFEVHEMQPKALKIAGGQGAVFNYSEILEKTPIQIVVRGFGEKTFEKILTYNNVENVPNLYLKKGDTILATTSSNEITCDVFKEISMNIDFSIIPYERYWNHAAEHFSDNTLKMMKNNGMLRTIRLNTSNYCPHGCSFCSSTNFLNEGNGVRQRFLSLKPEEVLSLMQSAAIAHPDVEAFYFNDDDFLLNKERAKEFCELLKKSDIKYNLMCMGRVDDVDSELLRLMNDSGFKIIFYGVETFSDEMATSIGKTRNLGYGMTAKQAILQTLDAGMTPQISLMLFLPKSSLRDIEITIENSLDMIEKGARVTVFPYVEAYSGADIVNHHELIYTIFSIEGKNFKMPWIVLPDDVHVRKIAEESLRLKSELNKKSGDTFEGRVPQPIDTLNLFSAVYMLMGKNNDRIESIKKKLI